MLNCRVELLRRSQVLKFGILGVVAIVLEGSIFLTAEPSRRLSLDDTEKVTMIAPKAVALATVESSLSLTEAPSVTVEIPLANSVALAGCECQGECGFAEQMRQSEP
jgi:hypothetical protein